MTPQRMRVVRDALEVAQRIRATPLLDFDTVLAREKKAGTDPAIVATALAVCFAECAARVLRDWPEETRLAAVEEFMRRSGHLLLERLDAQPQERGHVAH